MNLKDHPFFNLLDLAEIWEKRSGSWGVATKANKKDFFTALKQAHPFNFDKKVTIEKLMAGMYGIDFFNLVKDFSLPFKTSLYLLNDAPQIISPISGDADIRIKTQSMGYMIQEITPELFNCYSVHSLVEIGVTGEVMPVIEPFQIDLKRLAGCDWHRVDDATVEMHWLKEICKILQLTKSISVKRIGIEHLKSFSVKSRGISATGFTSIKTDNLYHIADKQEYDYSTNENDGEINWEWIGFWRGHWRAFYLKDSSGNNLQDNKGYNIVNYGKLGKNRQGEYTVPGYTWVDEHTKGNPKLAEIKQRRVVSG